MLEVPQFYFGLPNLCDPLRGFGKTPTVDVLARGLAAASQFALCAHPTRRLRRGRIPAPQNDICFAPAIRVSLNDSFRP